MWDGCIIPQPSTFWRGDLFKEVGGLNEEYDLAMDQDLWYRFSQVTKIWHVGRLWSRQRLHPQAKTWNRHQQGEVERGKIYPQIAKTSRGKMEKFLLHWGARGFRLLAEETLCIINWLKRGEQGRPRDNPLLGIGPGYLEFKIWGSTSYTKIK